MFLFLPVHIPHTSISIEADEAYEKDGHVNVHVSQCLHQQMIRTAVLQSIEDTKKHCYQRFNDTSKHSVIDAGDEDYFQRVVHQLSSFNKSHHYYQVQYGVYNC